MITQEDIFRIKELRDKGISGSKISKEIGKRKQETLKIIRQIEGKKEPSREKRLLSIPEKYLKPKQLIRKEKIIEKRYIKKISKLPLTKKEKDFINENVRKNESDYKIVKEFDKRKENKVRYEIKKEKNKIKKEKLKEFNKGNNCKFNYITQHHIGYKFSKQVNYQIYVNISEIELQLIIDDIKTALTLLNNKINCFQRINYCSLEYIIILQDNSKEYSKISTNISGEFGISSFQDTINQIPELIYYLYNLVHQSQSSKQINIYNVVYVNYDFKYNVVR